MKNFGRMNFAPDNVSDHPLRGVNGVGSVRLSLSLRNHGISVNAVYIVLNLLIKKLSKRVEIIIIAGYGLLKPYALEIVERMVWVFWLKSDSAS